jgi:hypothetical protein
MEEWTYPESRSVEYRLQVVGGGERLLAGTMVQQKIDLGTEDLIRMFRGDDLHPLFVSLDCR